MAKPDLVQIPIGHLLDAVSLDQVRMCIESEGENRVISDSVCVASYNIAKDESHTLLIPGKQKRRSLSSPC